jgi:molybdate transport system substrate-binding protein
VHKMTKLAVSALLPIQLLGANAQADEIRVLALQSPHRVLDEVAPEFERRTGYKIVEIASMDEMPIHLSRRIAAGEVFDAAFLVPEMMAQLAKERLIDPSTRTKLLRVTVGLAVKAGAPRPDISSVDAFKKTILSARSLAYLKAGISGPHLQKLFDRFGIAEEVKGKSIRPETDTVGELVASGEAEIGITAIATLIATPGIDIVGPIPRELQAYVSFEGAVATHAKEPSIVRKLLEFLGEPYTVAVFARKGMEPWVTNR